MVEELQKRIKELEDAIRKHREANGHDQCWENDEELYSILKDGVEIKKDLPPRCEFRQRCKEYYESRRDAQIEKDGW